MLHPGEKFEQKAQSVPRVFTYYFGQSVFEDKQLFKIKLAPCASFSRAHMCDSARALCISDPQDEISGLCLTLAREVEIKC